MFTEFFYEFCIVNYRLRVDKVCGQGYVPEHWRSYGSGSCTSLSVKRVTNVDTLVDVPTRLEGFGDKSRRNPVRSN